MAVGSVNGGTGNPTKLSDILQIGTVDVGNDTLFSRKEKLSVNKERLTLVISSGGSGAAAIKEAYRIAKQKLHSDFETYMKFIMVDSDAEEIQKVESEFGKGKIPTLNISTSGAAGRFVYEKRADFYRSFLPKDFDATTVDGHGAGRIRMNGKAKFYDAAEGGGFNDAKFRKMITDLYDGVWSSMKDREVDIMILAGLAGGNGSGTFEELAAHARFACASCCHNSDQVRVFGYFFLPDTMESKVKDPTTFYVNGYAALKELENYMSMPFNLERKEVFSAHGGIEVFCDKLSQLYDYPILISGTYDETKTMMAESIINLACESQESFSQNSFYSNMPTERMNHLGSPDMLSQGLIREDVFPEDSHYYGGIGYAYAAIPDEIVVANVVSNVCKKLYQGSDTVIAGMGDVCFCTDERRMSKTEMETQIRKLFRLNDGKVTKRSLWEQQIKGALERASVLPDNQSEISRGDITNGNVAAYRAGFREEECITHGKPMLEEALNGIFKSFLEASRDVMEAYGPKAMEYLYDGTGPLDENGIPQKYVDVSISDMLKYAKEEMDKIIKTNVNEPPYGRARGLKAVIDFFTHGSVDTWRGEFRDAVRHHVKQEIAKGTLEPGGVWERKLEELDIYFAQCARFAESLELLKNFYHSEGLSLDAENHEDFVKASQTKSCVNLCNDTQAYAWVQGKVGETINKVDMMKVRKEIIGSFVKTPELWTSDTVGKTRKEFDRIMAVCCELGIAADGGSSLTATEYFDYALEGVPKEQLNTEAQKLVSDIVRRLLDKSKPSLKKRQGSFSHINSFLMIPKTLESASYGSAIMLAFRSELQKRGVDPEALSVSPSVPDIVCYQTSVANALCDLKDIAVWEKAYIESKAKDKSSRHLINGEPRYAGDFCERTKQEIEDEKAEKGTYAKHDLHLDAVENIIFGTGLSLENYPPIALHNLENNTKESDFRKTVFDPIVEYALKEKIIEKKPDPTKPDPNKHHYVVNLIPKTWTDLDVADYDVIDYDGRFKRGESLFKYLRIQNSSAAGKFQKEIRLDGNGQMDATYDFAKAIELGEGMTSQRIESISIEYMKRKLRKNTKLFLELRETLSRYYDVVKTLEFMEREKKYLFQVKNFIKYYQFGLVFEENNNWYYAINAEGSKKTLSNFAQTEVIKYSDLEKKLLEKGWRFLLAYKKFTTLELEARLDSILEEKIQDDPDEMNKLSAKNTVRLCSMRAFIKKNIMDLKHEDMEDEDAIRKALKKMDAAVDEFYVKTLLAMWQELPEEKENEELPKDSWTCPKCKNTYPAKIRVCPIDDTVSPIPEPKPVQKDSWICPKCKNTYPAKIRVCPIDDTVSPIPEPKAVQKDSWICPECKNTYPAKIRVCPIDDTVSPLPEPKPEQKDNWTCPACNNTYPAKIKICPIDDTPSPIQAVLPDTWTCPACNNTYPARIKVCPIDDTPRQ